MPHRAEYCALLTEAHDLDEPAAPEAELAFWRAPAGPDDEVLAVVARRGRGQSATTVSSSWSNESSPAMRADSGSGSG